MSKSLMELDLTLSNLVEMILPVLFLLAVGSTILVLRDPHTPSAQLLAAELAYVAEQSSEGSFTEIRISSDELRAQIESEESLEISTADKVLEVRIGEGVGRHAYSGSASVQKEGSVLVITS